MLKKVLAWINQDRYEDHGDFIIFGKGLDELGLRETEDEEDIAAEISGFVRDFEGDLGRLAAHGRTSIGATPSLGSLDLRKFSPAARSLIVAALKELVKQPNETGARTVKTPGSDIDRLDAHYADGVLTKLDEVVRRAAHLDPLEKATVVPSPSVEKYFEEAHQCFLYGFPMATAVLCRAILEARLLELRHVLDPGNDLEDEGGRSKLYSTKSHCKALIRRAAEMGQLSDGRRGRDKRNSRHWAEEIIDAGNLAVHDRAEFDQKYGSGGGANRLEHLLLATRKAVIELLSKQEG